MIEIWVPINGDYYLRIDIDQEHDEHKGILDQMTATILGLTEC